MSHFKYAATTPTVISELVKTFCAELEPDREPVYVENMCCDGAMMGRCYTNVATFCRQYGGEIQFGWMIWELPGVYITAEHHAVVAANDGTLLDITPSLGNEKRILFLPSPLTWTGRPIINQYRPVKDTPLLRQICYLQERNLRLFFAGKAGCSEWQQNDGETVRLIDTFYAIKAQHDIRKRERLKPRKLLRRRTVDLRKHSTQQSIEGENQ